jgi:pyruvate formate lyase activating enzyme
MGQYKWKRLGMTYTLQDVQPPTNDVVQRVCEVFRAEGLKTV